MKSMTCRELGGKCDQKLTASSWDEMVKVMTKHVLDKHPDVARTMEKMHHEDPKKWGQRNEAEMGGGSGNQVGDVRELMASIGSVGARV